MMAAARLSRGGAKVENELFFACIVRHDGVLVASRTFGIGDKVVVANKAIVGVCRKLGPRRDLEGVFNVTLAGHRITFAVLRADGAITYVLCFRKALKGATMKSMVRDFELNCRTVCKFNRTRLAAATEASLSNAAAPAFDLIAKMAEKEFRDRERKYQILMEKLDRIRADMRQNINSVLERGEDLSATDEKQIPEILTNEKAHSRRTQKGFFGKMTSAISSLFKGSKKKKKKEKKMPTPEMAKSGEKGGTGSASSSRTSRSRSRGVNPVNTGMGAGGIASDGGSMVRDGADEGGGAAGEAGIRSGVRSQQQRGSYGRGSQGTSGRKKDKASTYKNKGGERNNTIQRAEAERQRRAEAERRARAEAERQRRTGKDRGRGKGKGKGRGRGRGRFKQKEAQKRTRAEAEHKAREEATVTKKLTDVEAKKAPPAAPVQMKSDNAGAPAPPPHRDGIIPSGPSPPGPPPPGSPAVSRGSSVPAPPTSRKSPAAAKPASGLFDLREQIRQTRGQTVDQKSILFDTKIPQTKSVTQFHFSSDMSIPQVLPSKPVRRSMSTILKEREGKKVPKNTNRRSERQRQSSLEEADNFFAGGAAVRRTSMQSEAASVQSSSDESSSAAEASTGAAGAKIWGGKPKPRPKNGPLIERKDEQVDSYKRFNISDMLDSKDIRDLNDVENGDDEDFEERGLVEEDNSDDDNDEFEERGLIDQDSSQEDDDQIVVEDAGYVEIEKSPRVQTEGKDAKKKKKISKYKRPSREDFEPDVGPALVVDQVRWSVSAPGTVAARAEFPIDVWGYVRQMREKVLEEIKKSGAAESGASDFFHPVARGADVTVSLRLHALLQHLGPKSQRITWGGGSSKIRFPVRLGSVARAGQALECAAEILVERTVIVVDFVVDVDATTSDAVRPVVTRERTLPLRIREVDSSEIKLVKQIGEGNFGKAFLADFGSGAQKRRVCVKYLKELSAATPGAAAARDKPSSAYTEFVQEMAVCQMLGHHPNVASYVGAVMSSNEAPGIVSEFYENGALDSFLELKKPKKSRQRSKAELVRMARDACWGVLHIHGAGIVHRDLAARNCLVDASGGVHVTDFGLSVLTPAHALDHVQIKAACMPVRYLAPESIHSGIYSTKSDSWMAGVMLWEIFAREAPFRSLTNAEAMAAVQRGEHVQLDAFPDDVAAVVKPCFSTTPKTRASVRDVVRGLDDILNRMAANPKQTHADRIVPVYSCVASRGDTDDIIDAGYASYGAVPGDGAGVVEEGYEEAASDDGVEVYE